MTRTVLAESPAQRVGPWSLPHRSLAPTCSACPSIRPQAYGSSAPIDDEHRKGEGGVASSREAMWGGRGGGVGGM